MATLKPKRNPRPLRVRNQHQPPLALVEIYQAIAGSLVVIFLEPRPAGGVVPFFGVPRIEDFEIRASATAIPITAVVFDVETQMLTFTVPDLPADTQGDIRVYPYTPGLRSRGGGYIAPCLKNFQTEP